MILTFAPDDGEKREWRFRGDRLLTTEAEAIEKVTGFSYQEFGGKLLQGNPTARRAAVWVMLKRDNPPLRYSEVDFPYGALGLEFEDEEKAEMREAVRKAPNLTDEERALALAELGGDEVPKADPAGEPSDS